jgi:charged multivesicular body protein 2A
MGNIFGKEVPLKEILRENKRMINRAIRELDRERAGLEREEKRIIIEIKKYAKEGQMGAVKTLAKDLVRSRQYITKFIEMRSHLQGVGLRLQTVKSHQAMADAMRSTAQAMSKMNKAVNIKSITKMLKEFEKENMKGEMMQEMMGDAIDDALDQDGNEEEEERIVGQVLDEIGISFDSEIPNAPIGKKTGESTLVSNANERVPEAAAADPAVDDLEARLNNLKR